MSDKLLLPVRPPQIGEMLMFKGVYSVKAIPNASGLLVTGEGEVRLCQHGDSPSGVIPSCYAEIPAGLPFWVCQHGPISVKVAE